MLFDRTWHSSTALDSIQVGDILQITNKDTLERVDWEVTEPPTVLSQVAAQTEWRKYPFGSARNAERCGFFPFVVRNLRKLREYPPERPSPRYIPSDVRVRVWLRDGNKCKNCGAQEDLEFDHIIPVAKGGSNTENNIELLCSACNRMKASHIR